MRGRRVTWPLQKWVLASGILVALAVVVTVLVIGKYEKAPNSSDVQLVATFLRRNPSFFFDHPDIILLAEQQKTLVAARQKRFFVQKQLALFSDVIHDLSDTFGKGSSRPKLTVIAFDDYECLPCRADDLELEQLLRASDDIRIIDVPLGILSSSSDQATAAVYAARLQGKAMNLHLTLMREPAPISHESLVSAEKSVGLNDEKVEADIGSPAVTAMRARIRQFAAAFQVAGAPTYVINCEVTAGRIDIAYLEQVRRTCSSPTQSGACCQQQMGR